MPSPQKTYRYSIEVEYEYSDNRHHSTPELKRLLSIAGINYLQQVTSRRQSDSLPIDPQDQEGKIKVVSAYYDGSVDSEVVIASDNALALSRSVIKMNKNIKYSERCGQHVSVRNDNEWFGPRTALAIQNISMAVEMGMLRKAKKQIRYALTRPSRQEVGEAYYSHRNWAQMRTSYDDMVSEKYSAIHLKLVGSTPFVEFRFHHPINNVYFFMKYLPKIIGELDQEHLDVASEMLKVHKDVIEEIVIYRLIAKTSAWKYVKDYIKAPEGYMFDEEGVHRIELRVRN